MNIKGMNISRKTIIVAVLILVILFGGRMLLTTRKSPREQMDMAVREAFYARTPKELERANKKIEKLSKKYNISPLGWGD